MWMSGHSMDLVCVNKKTNFIKRFKSNYFFYTVNDLFIKSLDC